MMQSEAGTTHQQLVSVTHLLDVVVSETRLAIPAHDEGPADAATVSRNVHSIVLLVDADECPQASCTSRKSCKSLH